MALRKSSGKPSKPAQILVGRQSELTRISRLLDEAKSGHGSFVGISGEPGIGKTRLAEESAAAAGAKGFTVFWGLCHDGQYIPPYWPWKEPLRGLLKMKRGFREGLESIVSETYQASRAMPKPFSDRTRLMILESATALIRAISQRTPLLLIMDNLHCADVPSLQLLEFVAREMRGQNVMIIGCYREPGLDSSAEFRPAIGALASQELFHGIPLSGWDETAVFEYLRAWGLAEPPGVLVRAVLDRTEGNPLFVAEVARLLKREGLLNVGSPQDADSWEKRIPHKIRLVILGQVQRLSAPCRDALSLAALAGREFESVVLRQAGHLRQPTTEHVLVEALAHGVIVAGRPGLYKFTHAMIQDVVLEQISTPRRSALHLKIGKVLERRYARDLETHAGELARHFDRAGPEGAKSAIHYYRLAGECSLRLHGFDDALLQLGRAIELEEGTGSAQDRARLLFGLAQSQHGVGRFRDSVESYTLAFNLFVQGGDVDDAIRMLEQPLIMAEKGADVLGLFERASILLGPRTSRAAALGGKYGLAVYHATGDYRKAVTLFDRALQAARGSGNRAQETTALLNRGRVECDELHFEEAHRLEQEACLLARGANDAWLEGMSLAADAFSLLGMGRLADAAALADLLRAFADRVHIRVWTNNSSSLHFAVLRQKGDLAGARDVNQTALGQSHETTADPSRTGQYIAAGYWNLVQRALLDFEQGDPLHGAQFLKNVEEEAQSARMPFHWEGWLVVLVSLIAWLTGEPVKLDDSERAARELLGKGGLRKGDFVQIHAGLGLIAVMRGNAEAAARHYRELMPFRGLVICPYEGIAADHLLALLAHAMGDREKALDHFSAALGFCRERGLLLELAYTCRDFAHVLLEGGSRKDTARAAALCQEAGVIARSSGLPFLRERLEALQKRLLIMPVPPPYPDSLSEREVEVLRLVAEGLSNERIGGRLFISPRTVANHVQRIMEKTRTANRTDAAMYAVRHDIIVPPQPPL
jgi:DNA-binding CsgD family transcriptional regulator